MPRREHQQTKRLIQQRQEQQRAHPSSTRETRGGGLGGQPQQGMTAQFQSRPAEPTSFVDFSTARSTLPAPLPGHGEPLTPQLDALYRASRALADHIAEFDTITDGAYLNDLECALDGIATPDIEVPFTPAQTTALNLTRQLASDLALHAHHSHLDELIRRIPSLGAACGRAVANALREAQ